MYALLVAETARDAGTTCIPAVAEGGTAIIGEMMAIELQPHADVPLNIRIRCAVAGRTVIGLYTANEGTQRHQQGDDWPQASCGGGFHRRTSIMYRNAGQYNRCACRCPRLWSAQYSS